jgi:hypothetical protein
MNHATKIATCAYCGTKTAIVLASGARHELTCSACAAPLDQMELLQTSTSGSRSAASDAVSPAPIAPTTPPRTRPKADETRTTKSAGFGLPWPGWKSKDDDDDDDDDKDDKQRKPKKSKKRKKRKSLAKKLFEEAADKIEDIFD